MSVHALVQRWKRGLRRRSHGHLHLDVGIGVVAFQFEVVEDKGVNVGPFGVDDELGERARGSVQLSLKGLHVVGVDVSISQHVYKFAWLKPADLCDHAREEGI